MLRDLTNPKKIDKQVVLAAITALRSRAWDVNPYTVGDEMKTSHTNIYRNSEVMELINEARQQAGLPMIHTEETLPESQESSESAENVAELQERVQQLENQNAELQELQKDNWQRGYKAGWDEASIYLANAAPFPTEPMSDSLAESNSDSAGTENTIQEPATYMEEDPEIFSTLRDVNTAEFHSGGTFDPFQDFAYNSNEDNSQQLPEDNSSDESQYTSDEADEAEESVSTEELQNILKQHRDKVEVDPAQSKAKGLAASKFARTPNEPAQRGFILRTVPPDIRKSCLVLGIRPEELSRQAINDAWKREITRPGTHPDQGGDSEIAVYLNTAKDVLLRWWETQEPKLGKQFGSQAKQAQPGAESEPDETEPSM